MAGLYRRTPAPPVVASNSPLVTLAPGHIRASTNAIAVPYGEWVLFRNGGQTVAIRIAAGAGNPIRYEWVDLTGQAAAAAPPAPSLPATTQEVGGWGHITAGQLRLNWSQGSSNDGWIYWSSRQPNMAISSRSATELKDLSTPDPTEKWYTRTGVAKQAGHMAPLPGTAGGK